MKKSIIAYRTPTTYEAFNVFWEYPEGEWSPYHSTPIGMLMDKHDVLEFAARHKLKFVSIADMIAYRQARDKLVERVGEFPVATSIGEEDWFWRAPGISSTYSSLAASAAIRRLGGVLDARVPRRRRRRLPRAHRRGHVRPVRHPWHRFHRDRDRDADDQGDREAPGIEAADRIVRERITAARKP